MINKSKYGIGDSSFQAAGGTTGIFQLVNDFYDCMETIPEATVIRNLHPKDLTVSKDKLAKFISGWLNGPNTFRPKYGSIHIPRAHQHLPIGESEVEAWLLCMQKSLDKQPYEDAFKEYLLKRFRIPAQRCRTN